jgi:hypothetical protein
MIRHKHGDPLRRYAASDGLEDDRRTLLAAVGGELLNPFSIARLQALGWCARPKNSKVGDWLLSMPLRYDLTDAGVKALEVARVERRRSLVALGDREALHNDAYFRDREQRQRWPEYIKT